MKKVKFIITAMVAVVMGINSFAQTNDHSKMSSKTETIKVSGKCEMCQGVIEKAAKVNGVSKASWNKDTKVLTLVYDPSKVKSEDVQKKIANAGYDTEKFKADEKAYKALPECCQYR